MWRATSQDPDKYSNADQMTSLKEPFDLDPR